MSRKRATPTPNPEIEFTPEFLEKSFALQAEQEAEKPFFNVPTSPASDLYLQVLTAGENVKTLSQRASHSGKYTIAANPKDPNDLVVIYSKGDAKIRVELENVNRLLGSNKAAKKMYVFSLVKLNEQAVHDGELSRVTIGFDLQELVDNGMYKSIRAARRGVTDAFDALTSMKVSAELTGKGKDADSQKELAVLFTYYRIKSNYVTVDLNPRLNWSVVTQYFTLLPKYVLALPNRAFDLAYYIFYLARQNTQSIKEAGHFNISFRAIQSRLQLPDESTEAARKDPQRLIKEPLESALVAIEDASKTEEFTITPIYDERASIKDYLDNGYLQIGLKGEYAETFIALADSRTAQIEHAQRRKEKIEDTARAKALQKHIEASKEE